MDCWPAGCSAGSLASWVTEVLGLLGLLERVFGFLALLEEGLNHVRSLLRSPLGEVGGLLIV